MHDKHVPLTPTMTHVLLLGRIWLNYRLMVCGHIVETSNAHRKDTIVYNKYFGVNWCIMTLEFLVLSTSRELISRPFQLRIAKDHCEIVCDDY